MSALSFLKTTVRDLATVGALVPSSTFTIRRIIDAMPGRTKIIVEYGPGDGAITRQLLDRLPPEGKLIAIELNGEFVEKMKEINDPRLIVVAGDAVHALKIASEYNLGPVDAVVCGIAFTFNYFFISKENKKAIVKSTHRLLRTGGMFILYQSSLLMMPLLREYFSTNAVFELRNLPPYFIIRAERKD